MKLYYQRFPGDGQNFGDDLNVWLWNKLLPDALDDDDSTVFVGIGTLLNDELPNKTRNAKSLSIFSSGVGYYNGPLILRPTDKVYCVRGPLSAAALGLPETAAVTDGALMVRRFVEPVRKVYKFSYMPHIEEIADRTWPLVCAQLGFGYIDPQWPVDRVLAAVGETEVLLAEAMHGAIVADALRVPWVPIVTKPRILSSKWHDWCASVRVEYKPERITCLRDPRMGTDALTPIRAVKHSLNRSQTSRQLAAVARTVRPFLSDSKRLSDLECELNIRLDRFRADVGASRPAVV